MRGPFAGVSETAANARLQGELIGATVIQTSGYAVEVADEGLSAGDMDDASRRDELSYSGSSLLRWSLRATDAVALTIAWIVACALWVGSPADGSLAWTAGTVAAMVAAGIWLINAQDLYLARVATMRTVEQARLVRVCVLLVAAAVAVEWMSPEPVNPWFAATGAGVSLLCLLVSRTVYRAWLKSVRSDGGYSRPVLLVGVDDQARNIHQVLLDQPELGFSVVGVLGDYGAARSAGLADLWRGSVDDLSLVIDEQTVTGAIVSSTALDPKTVDSVTRSLLDHQCHVHLSTGISGVDQRRLRPMHVGYEPLLYVEPVDLTRVQVVAKRVIDFTLALVAAIVLSPVLAVAAVAIKLGDRGPVLFRQERVGRGGELFTVLKLRTMHTDAEARLEVLRAENQRNGPLFKMDDDPRVTRAGRVLRATSIDELPQLWNVLRGDMSLVGPRPALPSEVLEFGERLQTRTRVLPGITGLWQVEARDNPSFHAYERLDLFYIENWSVSLDAMIIIATVESELSRILRRLLRRGEPARVIDLGT